MPLRSRMKAEGKIDKPEDREWKKWYEGLDPKEHEKKLAMLGLDKEDIEEWEQHSVLQDIEQEAAPQGNETQLLKKKKTR